MAFDLGIPLIHLNGAVPGDSVFFARPHTADHRAEEAWTPRAGGALCCCKRCGLPIGITLIVLGDAITPQQLRWLRTIPTTTFQ